MAHWVDTYPHDVYASVLLLDNKIYNYKIGERYWKTPFDMTWRFSVRTDINNLTVEHKKFTVHDSKEHEEVFNILSREWLENWEVHEEYIGSKPY